MSKLLNGDFAFGASLASLVQLIPDEVLTSAGKGVLFVVGAFVSGFAYKAGQALWDRMSKNTIKDDD
jgi:hypothetical protein